ncbi:unnamed protein product [Ceutorhynchus assimilis]|uniref:Uncharacterized protein n=1 Tax=Ceutorhynchus assimilis TaxID=467358 RepID=A0A9N9QRD3_9CUCU|nr:unnamed protein product [Ceutorhynchus assimilis]
MVILISENLCPRYLDFAEELLLHFVKSTKIIYGSHFLSHNFHNLLHLVGDVRQHGCLDNFSNFSSENFLQKIKKLIRKPSDILQQVVKRITEINLHLRKNTYNNETAEFRLDRPHCNGVLIQNCDGPQYKRATFKQFQISINNNDCCCILEDGKVILVKNFAICSKTNEVVVIGKYFKSMENFYTEPCDSSLLEIFFVKKLSNLCYWPIKNIKNKLVRLPYSDGFVIYPLHHSNSTEID